MFCLAWSILDLSKTATYNFWYDYVKLKYGENAKPFYMDTDSFIIHLKAYNIYKDIPKHVETRFDLFELDKPLPRGKNKKIIRLTKDE